MKLILLAAGQGTRFYPTTKDIPKAMDMIADLVADHETIGKTIRDAFKAAEDGDDEVTQDMLTQRLTEHEKTAWMLRSHLEKPPTRK